MRNNHKRPRDESSEPEFSNSDVFRIRKTSPPAKQMKTSRVTAAVTNNEQEQRSDSRNELRMKVQPVEPERHRQRSDSRNGPGAKIHPDSILISIEPEPERRTSESRPVRNLSPPPIPNPRHQPQEQRPNREKPTTSREASTTTTEQPRSKAIEKVKKGKRSSEEDLMKWLKNPNRRRKTISLREEGEVG